jgi:hypothetical protein
MKKLPIFSLWLFLSLSVLACQSKTDATLANNEAAAEDFGTGVPISNYIEAEE